MIKKKHTYLGSYGDSQSCGRRLLLCVDDNGDYWKLVSYSLLL